MRFIAGVAALAVLVSAGATQAQDKDKKKGAPAPAPKPAAVAPAAPRPVVMPLSRPAPTTAPPTGVPGGAQRYPQGSAVGGTGVVSRYPQGAAVGGGYPGAPRTNGVPTTGYPRPPVAGGATGSAAYPRAAGAGGAAGGATTPSGFPHAPGAAAAAAPGGFPRAPGGNLQPQAFTGTGRGGPTRPPTVPGGGQTAAGQTAAGRGSAVRTDGRAGVVGPQGQATATRGGRGAAAAATPAGWRVGRVEGAARSARRFSYHGRSFAAYRTWPYHYPNGFHYLRFVRGQYVPAAFLVADYYILDYGYYGLVAPLPGAQWVRVGPDALMLNGDTGEVLDSAPGLFDESLPPQEEPDPGPPVPVVDSDLPPEFSVGAFQLGHGPSGGCVRFYSDASARADLDASWQAEDWNGVARKVIAMGCETDLSFYLLGLSAEGLGLDQAAAIYYSGALSAANRQGIINNPYRSCRYWKDDACRGVTIADESRAGLQRIASRR